MDGLQGKTLLELMIWGHHYLWKHPYQNLQGWERSVSVFLGGKEKEKLNLVDLADTQK